MKNHHFTFDSLDLFFDFRFYIFSKRIRINKNTRCFSIGNGVSSKLFITAKKKYCESDIIFHLIFFTISSSNTAKRNIASLSKSMIMILQIFLVLKNLFCWMKSKNIQYDLDGFVKYNKVVGTDQDRINQLLQKIDSNSLKDFTLIYLGVGELAHFLSMDDPKFIEAMQTYDRNMASLYSALASSEYDFELVLLGDHGMVPISSYINIEPDIHRIARSLNLTLFEDYMFFIDSTMVRIWIKDGALVSRFESELFQVIGDSLETTGDIFSYLDSFKPDYGNIIALLKPEFVFTLIFLIIGKMLVCTVI